jgi:hypothetical protein
MFNTPILFLVFNRPEETKIVFEKIRSISPKKLYISSDGPRDGRDDDNINCIKVKNIVSNIDWECEVFYSFSNENLGCKKAISNAISWFFSNEEMGIILEDDCLPNTFFFKYCETLLKLYKDNDDISCINGNNFIEEKVISSNYFFSNYNHCWGWATWKRAWNDFDKGIVFWEKWKLSNEWKILFIDPNERKYWEKIFDKVFDSKIDSWAYAWTASLWNKSKVSITPPYNLVQNIGFGKNATHTNSSKLSNFKSNNLQFDLKLRTIKIDYLLDNYLFYKIYYVTIIEKILYKFKKILKY